MAEKCVTVQNAAGIHCRPSSEILNAVNQFPDCTASVITADNEEVELNSILSLISLGLQAGDQVTVKITGGSDEENAQALETIANLFEKHFDFPPQ